MSRKGKNRNVIREPKPITYPTNEEIFKFINPNSNDLLSKISGEDLQELIILLNEFYIRLRKKLDLDKKITFGLEIEVEKANKQKIKDDLFDLFQDDEWCTESDSSLDDGIEVVSPVLTDTNKNWKDLKRVCEMLEKSSVIGKCSAGHIHIGSQILGKDRQAWLNFVKLWSVYENIIFRFSYGEYLTARPGILKYAQPVRIPFWKSYRYFMDIEAGLSEIIYKLQSGNRYQAVNSLNVDVFDTDHFLIDNTLEFRCPNGTLSPEIWQNNVNLFIRILLYSTSKQFDDDLVNKRQKSDALTFKQDGFIWYNEIYLTQALELCDMIFDNNYDKICFLKQYLKSLQVSDDDTYKKGPSLTRRLN